MGKVGRISSQEVTIMPVKSNYFKVPLYCMKVCHSEDIQFLENRITQKLKLSNEIIEEGKRSFGVKPIVLERKLTFLQRYSGSTNTICSAITAVCNS